MSKTTEDQLKELQAQVAKLTADLSTEKTKRTEAEQMAEEMSTGSYFVGNTEDGYPTGKTVTVSKCTNAWEKNEKKHKYIDIELPTYKYTINLPVGAGICLSTNGVEFYHGQTYEFDVETLAEMKSRVARCWDHEKSIHSDNENAYRKQTGVTLSGKRK